MLYNYRAEISYPIYLEGRLYGILIFAESKSERIWTKEELRLSQSISLLIQNMLENADGDDNVRNVNKHLIETYNSFHEGIFIRDLYTGYVFFSNKALNDMLGYDLSRLLSTSARSLRICAINLIILIVSARILPDGRSQTGAAMCQHWTRSWISRKCRLNGYREALQP